MAEKYERLPPPIWDPELKTYEDWRFQVELWNKACDRAKVKPDERGYKLYDKLKDVKGKNVGEKISVAVQLGDIDPFASDSVDQIIRALDKSFKKDDLTLMHQSWSEFIRFKRDDGEDINEFLNKYERKAAALRRDKIVLPESVLAMQLIDSANMDRKEVQMVLTAVDYGSEITMYEQTQKEIFWS